MATLACPDFSLRLTLESGQYFRWRERGDAFEIGLGDRLVVARQEGETLRVEGADPDAVRRFLALDHDWPAIRSELARDPALREPLERFAGLRLLRQEPWECLVAFITSAASNLPRIARNVRDIAARFGTPPAFPRPGQMGTAADLRALRLGFRAPYLAASARLARDGRLDGLVGRPLAEVRAGLMAFPGVAEKVADCVALFAYERMEAFPVDTWIRRAMRRICFRGRKASDRRIRESAARRFGPWAGYAQQFLFVAERTASAEVLTC